MTEGERVAIEQTKIVAGLAIYIDHYRDTFGTDETTKTTLGKIYISNEYFCETLEDVVRAKGIKIPKITAIPANSEGYSVGIRYSPLLKDTVVVIYTRIEKRNGVDVFILERDGISFEYVLAHGGNKHTDTDACVLVAEKRLNDSTIQGTKQKELRDKVKKFIDEGYVVKWRIFNREKLND